MLWKFLSDHVVKISPTCGENRDGLRVAVIFAMAGLAFGPLMAADSSTTWEGQWSAPSLSNRAMPIVITLEAHGKALEQIGDYHGSGTWRIENDSVRIVWASGWIGLLRPNEHGGWELLTWRKESNDPPDDIQPATRR